MEYKKKKKLLTNSQTYKQKKSYINENVKHF